MAFFNEEKRKRIQHEIWVISTFFFTFLFLPISLWMFIIIIIIKKISFLRRKEPKEKERKKWNVESRWHDDDGNGKNVHTINLNLIQIAFWHHYKAKASLLLSPYTHS